MWVKENFKNWQGHMLPKIAIIWGMIHDTCLIKHNEIDYEWFKDLSFILLF